MSDSEPISLFGAVANTFRGPSFTAIAGPPKTGGIAFSRYELNQILNLYGKKVAAGEWRDYAIDALKEKAVFSVFRKSCEVPLYRIVKQPKAPRRQGTYSVIAPTGLILRRGQDLPQVLKAIDRGPKLVVA